jgi:hypothetical protein
VDSIHRAYLDEQARIRSLLKRGCLNRGAGT